MDFNHENFLLTLMTTIPKTGSIINTKVKLIRKNKNKAKEKQSLL